MSDAAVIERWNHTADLLALIANCNRDPKRSTAVKPEDLHPFAARLRRRKQPDMIGDISILKAIFVDGKR